jgi:hypothetical protein
MVYLSSIIVAIAVLHGSVFAQKKCIFFSTQAPEEDRDTPLVEKLSETFTVDVYSIDDVGGWVDSTLMHEYDFAFLSESIPSARAGGLKGAPIPLFITELWASQWNLMGWVPYNWDPDYYGTTEEDQNKVTIVNADHPLAAGFDYGTEIEIATLMAGNGPLTYSIPGIEFIQIATLSADPNKTVVLGVEAGTVLYNNVNVIDGSYVSENRVAAVGIMAGFNDKITDDGWKLIHAGIEWVLDTGGVGVESVGNAMNPDGYALDQNYPNPFNPSTSISFVLKDAGEVTLTVYDLLGKEIEILLDKEYRSKGNHIVNFDANNLASGVYLYKMECEHFTAIRKMLLVR